ncbi:MAG TPA: hypothetical protein VMB21_00820 [Candidatus Limnocylindria bacterium]|nr:hypothetical protein [Candidatus Limnocylindria bacterium]
MRPGLLTGAAVLTALASIPGQAAPATGPLNDRTFTLQQLDAQYLADPSQGAHFAGARAISILDASISAYYYSNGGNVLYDSIRPFVPLIEVGKGTQVAAETDGTVPLSSGFNGSFPINGGGTVGVGIGYSGTTHAAAGLATGILRNSCNYGLGGPGVSKTPAPPYDGFGAQGSATSSSEVADYVTASADTTLTLSGVWEGRISANPPGSFVPTSTASPTVVASGPTLAQVFVHMEISVYSAPRTVHHPGDGESGGYDSIERRYLGGVSFDKHVETGETLFVHEPFRVTIDVPQGDFYFYAAQTINAGGGSDPSQGRGGSVYAQVSTAADFEHTLQFNLTPDHASGATLASESGEFLTEVVPTIELAQSGSQLTLTWAGTATGYVLETAPTVSAEGSWTPVTTGITQADGQFTFQAPTAGGPAYYRLTKQ